MKRLDDKRAIVTGAASGIGRASALRFAEEGARVVACDVAEEGLAETVRLIAEAGGQARSETVDVSDRAAVQGLVDRTVADEGGLDVFYANAGISGGLTPLLGLTIEEWRQVLDVNLVGTFLCVQAAARHMVDHGGGSIICTASVAGLRSGAGGMPYSASKAGVISMVQLGAYQLAGTGVRVNAICPGLVETGMTRPLFEFARSAGKEDRIGRLQALRRAGQPVEIANMAVFLASDEASYVTGQALAVDGGLSASHPFVPGRMA